MAVPRERAQDTAKDTTDTTVGRVVRHAEDLTRGALLAPAMVLVLALTAALPVPTAPGRRPPAVVITTAGDAALVPDITALVDTAVARAIASVGYGWGPVLVVVPEDAGALASLSRTGDVSGTAAVTTAADRGPSRVLVNPQAFGRLSRLGRQVVITHEVVHVATADLTGPDTPAWLAEGFADHVAYLGVDQPLYLAAQELHAQVRAGQPPRQLPADTAFAVGNADASASYQAAWLAVALLHQRYGTDGLLEIYREVGRSRGAGGEAVDRALRRRGSSLEQFVADWSALLRRRLGG